MLRWIGVLVLSVAGCGSPGPVDNRGPVPTHRESVDGGIPSTNEPPKTEAYRTCRLDGQFSWYSEQRDSAGHPIMAASAPNQGAPTFFPYRYVGSRVMQATPYYFIYGEGHFDLSYDKSKAISRWILDAADRPIESRSINFDDTTSPIGAYSYDPAGRLLTRDNASALESYVYDGGGFLTHEGSAGKDSSWTCNREWTWTHGTTESVVVVGDTTSLTTRCDYGFDASDRLSTARCTGSFNSVASWEYTGGVITMTLAQSRTLAAVDRIAGSCEMTITRANFSRLFEPTPPDPRPSSDMIRRFPETAPPMPSHDCIFSPFEGDGR